MAQANPTWGEERIANELRLKTRGVGVTTHRRTVPPDPAARAGWRATVPTVGDPCAESERVDEVARAEDADDAAFPERVDAAASSEHIAN